MANDTSPEKTGSAETGVEKPAALLVSQPKKLEGLLETISLMDKVSETIGEDRSGDMGGAGGTTGGAQGDDDQISDRQKAIDNLPTTAVMQQNLEKHIRTEVKQLNKEVRRIAATKPGNAYQINLLYARIRRLNDLLAELLEASVDVIKRLYIRIFIDKQSVR